MDEFQDYTCASILCFCFKKPDLTWKAVLKDAKASKTQRKRLTFLVFERSE